MPTLPHPAQTRLICATDQRDPAPLGKPVAEPRIHFAWQGNTVLDEDFRGRVLPFDRAAARAYATIAAARRTAGRPISQFDCQIAAIARAREATVATRNTSDYEGCGIELINPWTFSARL